MPNPKENQQNPQVQQEPQPAPQPPVQPAPMPAWKASLQAQLDEIDRIHDLPAPNYNSPDLGGSEVFDYGTQQMRADYRDTAISRAILTELKALPVEKQKEFYAAAVGPDKPEETEASFLNKVEMSKTYQFLDSKAWGRKSNHQVLDAAEKVIPAERMKMIAEMAVNLKAPDEPGYAGPLDVEPYKEKIEALKKKVALENPKEAEANARLLDQVNEYLKNAEPEYMSYLNGYDSSTHNRGVHVNPCVDYTTTQQSMKGIQTLAGGQFNGIFKDSGMEDKMTSMMNAVNAPGVKDTKIFDGNVNSTRESTEMMPSKFAGDYVGHNKVNSLYCLNVYAFNTGVDPMEAVTDPVNNVIKAYNNYKSARGVDSRSTIGGKLCFNMQKPSGKNRAMDYHMDLTFHALAPRGRGLSGLLGLEPDPKRYPGLFHFSG